MRKIVCVVLLVTLLWTMYSYMHWCVEFENRNAFQMYKRLFYCTHTHTHTHTQTHALLMSLLFDQFDDAPAQVQMTDVVDVWVPFTLLYINSRFGNGWHSGHSNGPIWFWWSSCRWHGMADAREGWLSSIVSTMFLIFAHSSKRSATPFFVGFGSCSSCGRNHLRKSTQRNLVVTET